MTSWFASANCATTDPDLMSPEPNKSPAAAKRICDNCDVTAQCLKWAIDNNEQRGVGVGTTAKERAALRQQEKEVA